MHAKPSTHDMDIGKQDDNAIKKGDIMSVYIMYLGEKFISPNLCFRFHIAN